MECVSAWKDGVEMKVSCEFDSNKRDLYGYHRKCYQRFTDKRRIGQALVRKDKGNLKELVAPSGLRSEECEKVGNQDVQPSKGLRSGVKHPRSDVPRRSEHVLPETCIICLASKSTVDCTTKKRKLERLVTCETDGSKLVEAAANRRP